jgi:hypothetical protein
LHYFSITVSRRIIQEKAKRDMMIVEYIDLQARKHRC